MTYKKSKKRLWASLLLAGWICTGWLPVWRQNSFQINSSVAQAATATFTTSGQWQVPDGVNLITVEAWGGGGAGGGRGASTGQSGGGGGGAYASRAITVVPLQTYSYTVGAAVTGGNGNGSDGNPTFWTDGSMVKAAGGKGGAGTTTKGIGGAIIDSVGSTIFKGGDGADGGTISGGGGGGAGSGGDGGSANAGTAGLGTAQGGGNGGTGVTNANGNPGISAGGGGAGARRTNGNRSGGNGAAGQIKITYPIISVTVSDGAVDYGILGSNANKDTTVGGINDTQTATNTGEAAEDFNIKGQNSTSWVLGTSAGNEQYAHYFCLTGSGSPDPCDASAVWVPLTTSYQSLGNNIAINGSSRFDLKITTPTTTGATTQQSVNVTVQVIAH